MESFPEIYYGWYTLIMVRFSSQKHCWTAQNLCFLDCEKTDVRLLEAIRACTLITCTMNTVLSNCFKFVYSGYFVGMQKESKVNQVPSALVF